MSGKRKKVGLEMMLGLADGLSVAEAAARAGMSERTGFRWLQNPDFRAELSRIQGLIIRRAVGVLATGTVEMAIYIRQLAKNAEGEAVRLRAATIGLDLAFKGREVLDFNDRLDAIEERLKKEGSP